jgi:glycosyltransferase involved in cell wall biosynthesis
MNTPEAAAALKLAFPELATRTTSITNGYDSDEVAPSTGAQQTERFNIVHAGFLHAEAGLRQRRQAWQYRLLGRIEPGVEILPRSHYYLLRALAFWRTEDPNVDKKVRFTLIGKTRSIDRELVAHSPVAPLVRFTDYLPHADSLNLVQDASLLFLPMHKLPPGRRARIVPGKTYEYIASGRPVLAPIPEGDARDFLQRAGTGFVCEPDAVQEMVALLRARFRAWTAGETGPRVDPGYISRFERRTLTGQLASHLRALTHARAHESTIA